MFPFWPKKAQSSDKNQENSPDVLTPGSMILIPEGEFIMGNNDGPKNERPEHTIWLDAYYIDRFEVTMAEYQQLLDDDYSIEPPTTLG